MRFRGLHAGSQRSELASLLQTPDPSAAQSTDEGPVESTATQLPSTGGGGRWGGCKRLPAWQQLWLSLAPDAGFLLSASPTLGEMTAPCLLW